MTRTVWLILFTSLLLIAAPAVAAESTNGTAPPDGNQTAEADQAPCEDCPKSHSSTGNASTTDNGTHAYGPEDCIECSGPAPDQPVSSEDEDQGENAWVEDCPPDMMCAFEDGADDGREPDTGEQESMGNDSSIQDEAASNPAPVLGIVALSAVLAVVAALAGPGKR